VLLLIHQAGGGLARGARRASCARCATAPLRFLPASASAPRPRTRLCDAASLALARSLGRRRGLAGRGRRARRAGVALRLPSEAATRGPTHTKDGTLLLAPLAPRTPPTMALAPCAHAAAACAPPRRWEEEAADGGGGDGDGAAADGASAPASSSAATALLPPRHPTLAQRATVFLFGASFLGQLWLSALLIWLVFASRMAAAAVAAYLAFALGPGAAESAAREEPRLRRWRLWRLFAEYFRCAARRRRTPLARSPSPRLPPRPWPEPDRLPDAPACALRAPPPPTASLRQGAAGAHSAPAAGPPVRLCAAPARPLRLQRLGGLWHRGLRLLRPLPGCARPVEPPAPPPAARSPLACAARGALSDAARMRSRPHRRFPRQASACTA